MAILAECPQCHKKQAARNKKCSTCDGDLDKAKKSGRVKYWIDYRLPNGKQKREGTWASYDDAREALSKRTVQKREEPEVFDAKAEGRTTFNQLTDWYFDLERVKALSSFWRIEIAIKKFNSEFGDTLIKDIRPSQIENYQQRRLNEGAAPATVDREVGEVKTMINKAENDGMVPARAVLLFKKVKKVLKKNSNARNMILPPHKFKTLISNAPPHLLAILAAGFYSGMRKGEILSLTWDRIDMEKRFIQLEASDTKDNEPRVIPICDELLDVLRRQPKALHHNYVFTFRGQPITSNFKRSLMRACEKAEIPYGRKLKGGFTFHDLRHTFNTYMRKAGVPESVIMQITGHSTREMFDRYNTIDADDAKEAIRMFRGFLQRGERENVDQAVDQVE